MLHNISFEPMEFKYRDGRNNVVTIFADGVYGEYPARSNTFYRIFLLDKKPIVRVAQSRLLPGYKKKAEQLFGRPWLKKLLQCERIDLFVYDNWMQSLDGFPQDTDEIWGIRGLTTHEYWIIQCPDRIILHVMNNDEITVQGTFEEALRKLFPNKPIAYHVPVTVKKVVRD